MGNCVCVVARVNIQLWVCVHHIIASHIIVRELLAIQSKQEVVASYQYIFTSSKSIVSSDPDFRRFVLGYLMFDINISAGSEIEKDLRKCLAQVPIEWKNDIQTLFPPEVPSEWDLFFY